MALRSAQLAPSAVAAGAAVIHRALMDMLVLSPDSGQARRRPSLCLDSTPVVYSQPITAPGNGGGGALRMVIEAGGNAITVPQQIDLSLACADKVISALGWQSAAADLNGIVRRTFPRDSAALSHWWGGIWLAFAAARDTLQLRLYLNLRHGSAQQRWQRVADLLGDLADDRFEDVLRPLVARAAPLGIPVGLGVVLERGRLAGVRVYVGVHHPTLAGLMQMLPATFQGGHAFAAEFVDAVVALAGTLRRQAATVAYDFAMDPHQVLAPAVARCKVDLSCQHFDAALEAPLKEHLHHLSSAWCLDDEPLQQFSADLNHVFGGYRTEYLSLSLRGVTPSLAVYAKPDGLDVG